MLSYTIHWICSMYRPISTMAGTPRKSIVLFLSTANTSDRYFPKNEVNSCISLGVALAQDALLLGSADAIAVARRSWLHHLVNIYGIVSAWIFFLINLGVYILSLGDIRRQFINILTYFFTVCLSSKTIYFIWEFASINYVHNFNISVLLLQMLQKYF